ncbi:MAG: response regulator [Nitrospinae bacterium]|nr:response regulator [Nitrospinota bacterium]
MTKEEKLKDITLLYVEDDDLIRKSVSRFLARRCNKLIEASNGAEGLRAFNEHLPALVITDIEMPVMNGMEMIETILKQDSHQPIIITTGYDDDEHKNNKVSQNIIKPINLKELTESICTALDLKDDE